MDSLPLQCALQQGCWLSQSRAQQRSKWIGPPATLRWRTSSRPSNTASGCMSTHGTRTPTTCYPGGNKPQLPQLSPVFQSLHQPYKQCPYGTGSQTTEHLLQSCPIYEPLRKGIWPDHTPVARKLYGSLVDLRCTATFTKETGVSILRARWRRRMQLLLLCS